jgi:hypothetical protein
MDTHSLWIIPPFVANERKYKATDILLSLLPYATLVGLYFTKQNNYIKGKLINLTASRDERAVCKVNCGSCPSLTDDVSPVSAKGMRVAHRHQPALKMVALIESKPTWLSHFSLAVDVSNNQKPHSLGFR